MILPPVDMFYLLFKKKNDADPKNLPQRIFLIQHTCLKMSYNLNNAIILDSGYLKSKKSLQKFFSQKIKTIILHKICVKKQKQ